ncbi:Ig-like domain-containing protein [Sphaerisporangium corydalis]|uniref:Ig-like domain-containing protein n=1 Tax=Sphaerisporangium corydalis TaxID=1441875 RepID=A0ABV9EI59_9ACTN
MKTGFIVHVRRAIATTTTLTSSQNPSKKGQSVSFTATVTATGSAIVPTGTVIWRDGSVNVGTSQLEGVAQSTFSMSSMTEGTHNLTAFYQGNVTFDPSTSQVLIQKVDEAKKEVSDDDDDDDDDEATTSSDDNLERRCRHFRENEEDDEAGTSDTTHSKAWRDLRRRCHRHWQRHDRDYTTLIDRGIRRHIEGHYDTGGGGREYWDSRHNRWVPAKPRHHWHKPAPPVHHFAVTG